ncbi:MAG: hypothetical protein ACYCVV_16480 [Acidimicrobiales bacterium]
MLVQRSRVKAAVLALTGRLEQLEGSDRALMCAIPGMRHRRPGTLPIHPR